MNHDERRSSSRFLAAAAVVSAIAFSSSSSSATEPVTASPIAVGEVGDTAGMDASAIRAAAEGEIRTLDTSKMPAKRRFLVTLTVARSAVGEAMSCTANAILRDARTGAMIAIIEAGAQASGGTTEDDARRVAHAAVRSAMRRIPLAFASK